MSPPQGEVVPTATTSQLSQESQELTRLFHQIKKTLPILSYKDTTDEIANPVLNTLARYEPYHKSPQFPINDGKDVTTNLISVTAAPSRFKIPRESQQTSDMVTKIHEGTKRKLC